MAINFFGGHKAKKYEVTEQFKSSGVAEMSNLAFTATENAPVNAVAAKGKFTIGEDNAANKDTVTIGGITYTFVTSLSATPTPYEVKIGSVNTDTAANLVAAINGIDDSDEEGTVYGTGTKAHSSVTAEAGVGEDTDNIITVTASVKGVAGNAIDLDEDGDNLSWDNTAPLSKDHLAGGVNGTVGRKGINYMDSSCLYICTADNDVSGENWKKITLSNLTG